MTTVYLVRRFRYVGPRYYNQWTHSDFTVLPVRPYLGLLAVEDQRVCMPVCLLAYLGNHVSKFHEIFCRRHLWL